MKVVRPLTPYGPPYGGWEWVDERNVKWSVCPPRRGLGRAHTHQRCFTWHRCIPCGRKLPAVKGYIDRATMIDFVPLHCTLPYHSGIDYVPKKLVPFRSSILSLQTTSSLDRCGGSSRSSIPLRNNPPSSHPVNKKSFVITQDPYFLLVDEREQSSVHPITLKLSHLLTAVDLESKWSNLRITNLIG